MANLSICPVNSWASHATKTAQTTSFVKELRQHVRNLKPCDGTRHATKKIFVFKDLATSKQVFAPRSQQPYDGPYRVVRRWAKTFVVNVKGRDATVSIDRLKPEYVFNTTRPRHGLAATLRGRRSEQTNQRPSQINRATMARCHSPQQRGPLGEEDGSAFLSKEVFNEKD